MSNATLSAASTTATPSSVGDLWPSGLAVSAYGDHGEISGRAPGGGRAGNNNPTRAPTIPAGLTTSKSKASTKTSTSATPTASAVPQYVINAAKLVSDAYHLPSNCSADFKKNTKDYLNKPWDDATRASGLADLCGGLSSEVEFAGSNCTDWMQLGDKNKLDLDKTAADIRTGKPGVLK
jgi:hypothetical protein